VGHLGARLVERLAQRHVDRFELRAPPLPLGATLFRTGDRFDSLYVVWTGFFRTQVLCEDGQQQVTSFLMGGELLGLDGISGERHTCDAVALEGSQVCQMPYGRFEGLAREIGGLWRQLHKLTSGEIVHDHRVMLLLGGMRARLSASC